MLVAAERFGNSKAEYGTVPSLPAKMEYFDKRNPGEMDSFPLYLSLRVLEIKTNL